MSKLSKKAFLNAVSSFLDFGAKIVVSMIVTPIIVNGLGEVMFGIWQMLTRFGGFITVADGRPTSALKWVIANSQNNTDTVKKKEAIGNAIGVWMLSLPILVTIGIVFIWLAPGIVKATSENFAIIRLASVFVVLNIIFLGLISIPEAVLRGMNLGYKRMGVVAGLNVIGGGLIVVAVNCKFNVAGIAGAIFLQTILAGGTFYVLVKRYLPWIGIVRTTFKEKVGFLKLSLWYSGWNIVNKLLISSDVIVLGVVLTNSIVSRYVLSNYMAQTMVTVILTFLTSAMPGLGGIIGEKKYEKIYVLRKELFLLTYFFISVFGSLILLANKSFISLWVGPQYYVGPVANALLLLNVVQLVFIRNDTYLIDLTLDLKEKVLVGFLSSVISILLGGVLAKYFGIEGLCAGVFIGRLLLSIVYPRVVSRLFKNIEVKRLSIFGIRRQVISIAVLFALSSYSSMNIAITGWLQLTVMILIITPLIVVATYIFGIDSVQKNIVLNRVKQVIKRK